jgi:hypothetical protein
MSRWTLCIEIIVVLVLTLSACDSAEPLPPGGTTTTTRPPPPPPPSPQEVQEVDECEGLVEVGVLFVENMVATLESGLSVGVLTGEEPAPPEVQLLQEVGGELDRRAELLGCEVGELNQDIVAGVEGIESTDSVVALFLDIVRSGVVSFLPDVTNGGADS